MNIVRVCKRIELLSCFMFQKTLKNYMSTIFAMSDLCDNSIKKTLPQMGLCNKCVDTGHLEFLPPIL